MSDDLLLHIRAALPSELPKRLGVAVSGGGDSIALLVLLQRLTAQLDTELSVVTVDHGLRPEAAAEAASVAKLAREMNLPQETLHWRGWDKSGNLQNEARRARYALISDWARANHIAAVALGHTLDDQAETVVMRLARGAGVDGLSAMCPEIRRDKMIWLRPLLGLRRDSLRHFLQDEGVNWCEDPSNEDRAYDRIKAREALAHLEPLGVTPDALAQVAANMHAARVALDAQTQAAAVDLVQIRAGGLEIASSGFDALPDEIARRLIVAGLKWVSGSIYSPRRRSLSAALTALKDEGSATLDGCRLLRWRERYWVFREFNAVKGLRCSLHAPWDGRWQALGPDMDASLSVAALGGGGLAHCPNWRDADLPRDLLIATPAIWADGVLYAAPIAKMPQGWSILLKKGETSFFDALISH